MNLIGPVVVALPLLVSLVICGVAGREGRRMPTRPLMRLVAATIAAMAVSPLVSQVISAVVMFPILFVAFAIPVMHSIERSAKTQLTRDMVLSASLAPRHLSSYVPLWARVTTFVAILAGLASVTVLGTTTSSPRTMLLGFGLAGLTFFGLYEAWMRQELFSVRSKGEDDLRQRVRAVFAAQSGLTLSFLLMAALSVGVWPGVPALGVVAVIVGGTGCAFALSTGIQERYLKARTVRRPSST